MADETTKVNVGEYLDIELSTERWQCHKCGHDLGSAHDNYKEGCLIRDRDPREVHRPVVEGEFTFAPDEEWCRILEFYCPGCTTMIELEYLPPGHGLTRDIEPDIEQLKIKHNVT